MESNYQGHQTPGDAGGQFGAQLFLIKQVLSRLNTMTLVKVIAVTNSGGVSPVGFVDVQPLVNQIDGAGNGKPHKPLYHLPYSRLQGGGNAVILDPKVGDIGVAGFASRSIAKVKNTKKQSNPDTFAQFSMSDGMYLGGMLNGTPTQYIQFADDGITIHSPSKVTISAPVTQIDSPQIILNGALQQGTGTNGGDVQLGGTLTADVDVVANGISLHNHSHPDPQGGTVGLPT